MGKSTFSKILGWVSLSSGSAGSWFCFNSKRTHDYETEKMPLIARNEDQLVRLRDVVAGKQTLATFQLKPKMVILKVSMHCNGCARKVEKHISKMEGVTSFKVDLKSKMVVVIGDRMPFEVLESVSKVKNAELWS